MGQGVVEAYPILPSPMEAFFSLHLPVLPSLEVFEVYMYLNMSITEYRSEYEYTMWTLLSPAKSEDSRNRLIHSVSTAKLS